MARPTLSLPFESWPPKVQEAWTSATAPASSPFDEESRVAKWCARTQHQARLSLGRWLQWLMDQGIDTGNSDVVRAATKEELEQFFTFELTRKRFGAVYNTAVLLVGAMQALNPTADFTWSGRVLRRLRRRSRREVPATRHIEHGRALRIAGLAAMDEADASLDRFQRFRDGLCVALLAATPMRIKNFSEIEIDRHLQRDASGWFISLPATETKTGRPDRWPVPHTLQRDLEEYLSEVRPALLSRGSAGSTNRLWIGNSGTPVGDQTVRKWIKGLTAERFGSAVLPHSFRHSAAVTLTLERPGRAVEAAALLGHASPRTTEKHYILQKELVCRDEYLSLLQYIRNKK